MVAKNAARPAQGAAEKTMPFGLDESSYGELQAKLLAASARIESARLGDVYDHIFRTKSTPTPDSEEFMRVNPKPCMLVFVKEQKDVVDKKLENKIRAVLNGIPFIMDTQQAKLPGKR